MKVEGGRMNDEGGRMNDEVCTRERSGKGRKEG